MGPNVQVTFWFQRTNRFNFPASLKRHPYLTDFAVKRGWASSSLLILFLCKTCFKYLYFTKVISFGHFLNPPRVGYQKLGFHSKMFEKKYAPKSNFIASINHFWKREKNTKRKEKGCLPIDPTIFTLETSTLWQRTSTHLFGRDFNARKKKGLMFLKWTE